MSQRVVDRHGFRIEINTWRRVPDDADRYLTERELDAAVFWFTKWHLRPLAIGRASESDYANLVEVMANTLVGGRAVVTSVGGAVSPGS